MRCADRYGNIISDVGIVLGAVGGVELSRALVF
jgi:hypothetical protein